MVSRPKFKYTLHPGMVDILSMTWISRWGMMSWYLGESHIHWTSILWNSLSCKKRRHGLIAASVFLAPGSRHQTRVSFWFNSTDFSNWPVMWKWDTVLWITKLRRISSRPPLWSVLVTTTLFLGRISEYLTMSVVCSFLCIWLGCRFFIWSSFSLGSSGLFGLDLFEWTLW